MIILKAIETRANCHTNEFSDTLAIDASGNVTGQFAKVTQKAIGTRPVLKADGTEAKDKDGKVKTESVFGEVTLYECSGTLTTTDDYELIMDSVMSIIRQKGAKFGSVSESRAAVATPEMLLAVCNAEGKKKWKDGTKVDIASCTDKLAQLDEKGRAAILKTYKELSKASKSTDL